jgi:hypothetical protein
MGSLVRAFVTVACAVAFVGPVRAQEPQRGQDPQEDASDLMNALLSGLMGFKDVSDVELQQEIAEVGGISFRSRVPLDYMSREELSAYLKEVLDAEYPPERASADERMLKALDLLPPGTDLRGLRARLLLENIAGFYDERPGKKRLYAVSRERKLTPANQVILAHELRHALQDQYTDIHNVLPDSVGDYDDRRVAILSLFEGDATLVMERFLLKHVPGAEGRGLDLSAFAMPEATLPGVPEVVRDQLVQPYFAGREFAHVLWQKGGWDAVRKAWLKPPRSTEQVLHPEKYLTDEAPLPVTLGYEPPGGKLISEGVVGEMLIRSLLGSGSTEAASGWGGDSFRLWDVSGGSLLAWRIRWDTPADSREFLDAALARFTRSHGAARPDGAWTVFSKDPWKLALSASKDGAVTLVASDLGPAFGAALLALH